jgi:hypothetical protein
MRKETISIKIHTVIVQINFLTEKPLKQLLLIYLRSWNVSLNVEPKILSKFRFLKKRKHFCVIRSLHIFKKIKVSFLFNLIMTLFNEKELKYYE